MAATPPTRRKRRNAALPSPAHDTTSARACNVRRRSIKGPQVQVAAARAPSEVAGKVRPRGRTGMRTFVELLQGKVKVDAGQSPGGKFAAQGAGNSNAVPVFTRIPDWVLCFIASLSKPCSRAFLLFVALGHG